MNKFSPNTTWLFGLLLILCYFPLFLHLDQPSLRLWDEARRAVNAFEMVQNGNWLVTHYDGAPEMWGTKPPFLVWCQALCMKLFGFNELAVRLPSALAGLATVLLLFLFSHKVLKKPAVGFLAALVLLTTRGYISAHGTRSGDFEALLTLWETGYLLAFFVFIHGLPKPPGPLKDESDSCLPASEVAGGKKAQGGQPFQNPNVPRTLPSHPFRGLGGGAGTKWLYLTALFITLAALTKGIAGFFFLPGLFLYALFQKQLKSILLSKHTWFALLGVLGVIGGYYFLRETANPGYLQTVWENEIGGRYIQAKGGHDHPWWFYFKLLYKERFVPWLFFLPLGIFAGFLNKGIFRDLTALILFSVVFLFAILTGSQTKIVWYMVPAYPVLALLVGIGLEAIFSGACRYFKIKSTEAKNLFWGMFVMVFFYQPYRQTIDRVYLEKHPSWDLKYLKFRDFMRRTKEFKNYTIVHRLYNSHVQFYKNVYNLKGYNIASHPMEDFDRNKYEIGIGPLEFQSGDTLMICEKKVYPKLDEVYEYEVLKAWDTCKLLTVKSKKE